jgi:Cdc6-like AAA superfamily ATPase
VVIGAPGSGKTVTLGRLAYGVATSSDWKVVVVDAKGDPATQAAFVQTMRRAGRDVRLFPQEPYDAWRGTGREIANRLVQLIDWADEGGGAYYRDLSVNLVRLACGAPGGPPRSSAELLARLDKTALGTLWAGHARAGEIERFRDEHIDACRQRYRSFFDATAGQLDGSWAFEDADCAYVLLNELLYAEETTKVARLLVEDFKQYLAGRNPERRQVLLIVDEFSAIADGERMARMVEVVRSYGAAVVLAPQCLDGWAGPKPRRGSSTPPTRSSCMPSPSPSRSSKPPAPGWRPSGACSTSAGCPPMSARPARSTSCASTPTRSGACRPACAS